MDMASFSIPQEVQELFDRFEASGYKLYLVGGAVRDAILGKMVYDWDFTTDAPPEKILE
jgi:poly(A) polymerase